MRSLFFVKFLCQKKKQNTTPTRGASINMSQYLQIRNWAEFSDATKFDKFVPDRLADNIRFYAHNYLVVIAALVLLSLLGVPGLGFFTAVLVGVVLSVVHAGFHLRSLENRATKLEATILNKIDAKIDSFSRK